MGLQMIQHFHSTFWISYNILILDRLRGPLISIKHSHPTSLLFYRILHISLKYLDNNRMFEVRITNFVLQHMSKRSNTGANDPTLIQHHLMLDEKFKLVYTFIQHVF